MGAPPLDSPCDGPVTYPGDIKILVKFSKGRSGPTVFTHTYVIKLGSVHEINLALLTGYFAIPLDVRKVKRLIRSLDKSTEMDHLFTETYCGLLTLLAVTTHLECQSENSHLHCHH